MKKFVSVLVLVIAVLFVAVDSNIALAGPEDYTVEWNHTNVYSDDVFNFAPSGLDTTIEYRWTLQLVTLQGQPFFDVGTHTHGPGAGAVTAFSVGPTAVQPYMGDWPFIYTGPFQVVDNFGNVVMRGFVAPNPDNPNPDEETSGHWDLGIGFNAAVDKIHIGSATNLGSCPNAAYQDYVGAWHYQKFPCRSGVQDNVEFAIMHYNFDCTIGWPNTDTIRIYTFDGTEVFQMLGSELLDYNDNFLPPVPTCLNPSSFRGFEIINTGGGALPFIDHTYDNAIFGANSVTNPHRFDFEPGVYYYQKRDAVAAHVADGEAPFFVSNAPAGLEWSISISQNEIQVGSQQSITYRARTPAIWSDYHFNQLCGNLAGTWTDSTLYSYVKDRTETRPVPAVAFPNDLIKCQVEPGVIGTVDMTVGEAEVEYFSEFYDVNPAPAVDEATTIDTSVNTLVQEWHLNSDMGLNILFSVIMLVVIFVITIIPVLRKSIFAYVLAWTAIGGAWVFAGPATPIAILLFTITTAVLWIWFWQSGHGDQVSEA